VTLQSLALPAPWSYHPETGVRLCEAGRPELDVVVAAEVWRHPEHHVGIFHTHTQPERSPLADLSELYGIEVSGFGSFGRQTSAELEPHLQHARRRGWLS
jgi:hypothetical protein